MKRSLLNGIVLVYLSAGCGSSYQVGGPSADVSVQLAASRLHGEEVTITVINGNEYEGTIQALTSFGLAYKLADSDSIVRVPLTSLRSIRNPESQVSTAAPLGGLVGCVVGGALGATEEETQFVSPILAGAALGTIAGLGVGTIVGLTWAETYDFHHEQAHPNSVAKEKP